MVIVPWPGRNRTRATASLRRPVVWERGAGTAARPPRRGELQGLGRLGLVGVFRPGVDLELGELLAAERALGQHAPHGTPHELVGAPVEELGVAGPLEAARVAAVAVGELV